MNLHEGHRERLRERYINEGGRNFAAHNLLELLLFYGIPRKDTNGIAHQLLNRFGDIEGVFNARLDDLCAVPGMTKSAAILISLTNEITARMVKGDLSDIKEFNSFDEVGEYLVKLFYGLKEEYVYAMFLDTHGNLVKCDVVCRGSVNAVALDIRSIVSMAFNFSSVGVVIAHNHPGDCLYPSNEDLMTTRRVRDLLKMNGIELVEHFIISGGKHMRILKQALDVKPQEIDLSFFNIIDEEFDDDYQE